jgi:hypothetical protein
MNTFDFNDFIDLVKKIRKLIKVGNIPEKEVYWISVGTNDVKFLVGDSAYETYLNSLLRVGVSIVDTFYDDIYVIKETDAIRARFGIFDVVLEVNSGFKYSLNLRNYATTEFNLLSSKIQNLEAQLYGMRGKATKSLVEEKEQNLLKLKTELINAEELLNSLGAWDC